LEGKIGSDEGTPEDLLGGEGDFAQLLNRLLEIGMGSEERLRGEGLLCGGDQIGMGVGVDRRVMPRNQYYSEIPEIRGVVEAWGK